MAEMARFTEINSDAILNPEAYEERRKIIQLVTKRISKKSFRLNDKLKSKVDKLVKVAILKKQLLKLPKHPEVKRLLQETHTLEWFVRVESKIERIQNMKRNLVKAIELLNIDPDHMFAQGSFLDFAILLALYYLKLHIIERVISGEVSFSKKVEVYIWRDMWQRFEKKTYDGFDETVAWTLEQLD